MTEKECEISAVTVDPLHPQTTYDTLTLPPFDRIPLELGLSSQSMRTSSFAMSDVTDPCPPKLSQQNHESIRIRKAYSRPSSPTRKILRTTDTSVPETENVDYFDEKDFRNTDRYVRHGESFVDEVWIFTGSEFELCNPRGEKPSCCCKWQRCST
jgi:hypothetical protein